MPRALLTLALLLASLILPACWSHQAARPRTLAAQHPAPPTPLPANAWPSRSLDAIQKLYDDTPEKVFSYRLAKDADPAALTDIERNHVENPSYTVTYKGIHANSLLRIFATPDDSAEPWAADAPAGFQYWLDSLFVGFSPNARFISSRTLEALDRRAELSKRLSLFAEPAPKTEPDPRPEGTADQEDQPPAQAKTPPRIEVVSEMAALQLDQGLPLRIPPVSAKPPKGLAIHLQSLAGNEFEPKVLKEFASRGWAIIDIKTQTSINSPVPDAWYEEISRLSIEERELSKEIFTLDPLPRSARDIGTLQRNAASHPKYPRLQEVQKRLSKLRQGGFDASRDEDLPALAATIASELDQALAGAAYAVEGVLDYVDKHRPDLQDIPVVMLGFSAGALATPTAAARVDAISPGRVSAIVLVGGACNLFRVSQESSFTDGGLKIRVGENRAPKPTIEKLGDHYLGASKLDPYHTAPLIAHIPVLQVHASTDTWVPASCGELLYERLNYPERLVMSGDHDFLFYFLPNRAKWIADWTERAAMPARQSAK